MTTIVIACAAALFATALAVTVFAARTQVAPGDGRQAPRGRLGARRSGWRRWCATSRVRSSAPRQRTGAPVLLGELGGSIDLDEVLTRTLAAAGELEGVDAAVISIPVEGGEPLVAAAGLGGAAPPATDLRPAGREVAAHDRRRVRLRPRRRGRRGRPDPRRSRRAAALGGGAAGLSDRLFAQRQSGIRRVECRRARGPRAPGRPGDRQRAPLPRGAPARRSRRADGTAQPALLPRDAAARGRAGAAVQPQPRARRLRPRRLQGDQRPDRTPRGRRGARRGRRSASSTSCAPPTSPAASAATSSR